MTQRFEAGKANGPEALVSAGRSFPASLALLFRKDGAFISEQILKQNQNQFNFHLFWNEKEEQISIVFKIPFVPIH